MDSMDSMDSMDGALYQLQSANASCGPWVDMCLLHSSLSGLLKMYLESSSGI